MAVLVVPTSTTLPDYLEVVTLENVLFQLRFRWNDRMSTWFMDVFDASGAPIVYGRRCVVDWPLSQQHRNADGIFAGEMIVYDTTLLKRDPLVDDFGERVLLLYFEEADLTAIGAR